jgi:hypothetical protein
MRRLEKQMKQVHPEPITAIAMQPKGRPPILGDLDAKLITFLKAIRNRGGIIIRNRGGIHVVRVTAQGLIESHSSSTSTLSLQRFSMPCSWVRLIYKRMGYTK